MALMFPDRLPADVRPESREAEFYERFKAELGDEWTVYYDIDLTTPAVPRRQIDFLLVGPPGIVALELKNSLLRKEGGHWQRFDRHSGRWMKDVSRHYAGPVDQAHTALAQLQEFLKSHNGNKPPAPERSYRSGAILLQNESSEFGDDAQFIIGKGNAEGSLKSAVDEFLGRFAIKATTEEQRQRIHEVIRWNLNLVESFSERRDRQERQLIALTRKQNRILSDFERRGRLLLEGVAGSGKTLLAREAARRASNRKQKTLFLCHSSNLSSYLKDGLSDCDNLDVYTFAGFCNSVIEPVDPEFLRRSGSNRGGSAEEPASQKDAARQTYVRENYVKETLPQKAAECYRDQKYDVLIVDEGQDLFSIDQVLFLDMVLAGGFESGRWFIAYDSRQALLGEISDGLSFLEDKKPRKLKLHINIRTPGKVYAFLRKLAGLKSESRLSDVMDLNAYEYSNEEEAEKLLVYTLNHAIREAHYQPEEIVILSPAKKSHTEGLDRKEIYGDHRIIRIKDGRPQPGKVGFLEIDRYKGLESSFVILMGIDRFDDPEARNWIYVALTRTTGAAAILYHERNRNFFAAMG